MVAVGMRAWWTLALLTAAYILSFVDRLIVSIVVQPLKADLDLTDVQISLLQGAAFAVFYAIMGIPLGRAADLANRRLLIVLGVVLWSGATIACGVATTFAAIFLARVLVGVGEAVLSPAAFSIFSDTFPRDRLARVIGIYTTGGALGNGIALLGGGAALKAFTATGPLHWPIVGTLAPWQSTFVSVGLPGLLIAVLLFLTVREPTRTQQQAAPSIRDVLHRLRAARSAYGPVMMAGALNGIVAYAYVSWAPVFLSRRFALAPADAGLLFGAVMLSCGAIGPVVGGWLCDIGTRRGLHDAPLNISQWGFIAMAVLGPLTFNSSSVALTMALMCLLTLSFTTLLTQSPVAVQLITPSRMRGQMSAVNLMIANILGLGLGPLLSAGSAALWFDGEIGAGVSLTVAAAAIAGAVVAWFGRPHLFRAVKRESNE